MLCQCTQHYDQKDVERYIIESERQWAESVASGDTTVIQRILLMTSSAWTRKDGSTEKLK